MKEQEDLHQSLQTRLLIRDAQQDELADTQWDDLESYNTDEQYDYMAEDETDYAEEMERIENEVEYYDET